jgi:PIN domain nuclease of toxin-antitoxin system
MARKSSSESGPLLLDTHILLWLASGDERLGAASLDIVEQAARRSELRLSVITLWEIGYLARKGRISLTTDLKNYWSQILERLAAQDISITADDIFRYHQLPNSFHGDPEDRFLVSQAMTRGLRLLTADKKIIAQAGQLAPAFIVSAIV